MRLHHTLACFAALIGFASAANAEPWSSCDDAGACPGTETCVEAKCTLIPADGSSTTTACKVCETLAENACDTADIGKECGAGKTCQMFGCGHGGGAVGGDGYQVNYQCPACTTGSSDGGGSDGGLSIKGDAAAGDPKPDASSSDGDSGGCTLAPAPTESRGWSFAILAAVIVGGAARVRRRAAS